MSAEPVDAPVRPGQPRPWRPSFLGSLRALWLFTWKSQTNWSKLSAGIIGLFALPALVYMVTPSPQAWAEKNRLRMGNPATYLSGFSRRATRAEVPLRQTQQVELARIFREEFRRAEQAWTEEASADPNPDSYRDYSDQAYARILDRVRDVLDEPQFTEYQRFERRQRNQRNQAVGDSGWGRTGAFYRCLMNLYFFILLPLNCVRMCGGLIRDELEASTLPFLTTRPLSRAQLLTVKYLAQMGWLEIWLAVQTLLILAAGWLRQVPDLGKLLPLLLCVQVLAVLAWGALGLMLGLLSKRYMPLALLYGVIVEMGIGRIPTNINNLSLMRHLQQWLAHNPTLQTIFQWPTAEATGPITALLLATSLFLIGGTLLFTFKEFHQTHEMQK